MIAALATAQHHNEQRQNQSTNARRRLSGPVTDLYNNGGYRGYVVPSKPTTPVDKRPRSADTSSSAQLGHENYEHKFSPRHDEYHNSVPSGESFEYPGAVAYECDQTSTHGGHSEPGLYPSVDLSSIPEGRLTPCDTYCRQCGSRVVTVVILKRKRKAWVAFMVLFVLFLWPFCLIPLIALRCHYPVHFCPKCDAKLSHCKHEQAKNVDQELETP